MKEYVDIMALFNNNDGMVHAAPPPEKPSRRPTEYRTPMHESKEIAEICLNCKRENCTSDCARFRREYRRIVKILKENKSK